MTVPPTPPPSRLVGYALGTLAVLVGALGYATLSLRSQAAGELAALRQGQAELRQQVALLVGEVTRMRIEQSSDAKGIGALLEKLRHYAPLLADSRVAQPDYDNAAKEMNAVMRAFGSHGRAAFDALLPEFRQCNPVKEINEMKAMLRAMTAADPERAKELLTQLVQGYHRGLPNSPLLRWFATDALIAMDKAWAGITLRNILAYESCRGINVDRAAAYNIPIPDNASLSTGFHNFISRYVTTDDKEIDNTLIAILGRAEHDLITVQECVKELGNRRCAAAVKAIERAYRKPPAITDNPVFLMHCLDALTRIQGTDVRPFLEGELGKASELVAKHIQHLLDTNGAQLASPRPQNR